MEYSIKINSVTKEYKLYKNDKDRFKDLFFGKRYKPYKALDKLDIALPKGEVIGILGKNGSGKSTLLKMVTGVTFPTEGNIEVDGNVSALLELTAGFNGDLTGRENIYLKGYGLGFTRDYIDSKIDDIIDFAEIGEYIDQPVRMYSSGMKSRLGFAISINIDPDILVVDEVLAVGDEIFRKKCMDKMNEFKKSGKTILFVSHSINQIKSFCTKGLWLHKGKMLFYDNIETVSRLYEQYLKGAKVEDILKDPEKYYNIVELQQNLRNIEINDGKFIFKGDIEIDRDYDIDIKYIELKSDSNELKIYPQKQDYIKKRKKSYHIEINPNEIEKGSYKIYIYIDVRNKEYKRQIWYVSKTGKYIDASTNLSIDVKGNRLTLNKE
ncbi:ABC transporter ATP-binding protein [Romboutsia ilealis]|uniref:ABC transporter ATP-binding protein n=1 Tax=Romboutsia faecis TaxID=2764597 RepID=A0ABR7JLS4_9FIRM|nr:ABC transporter ATP-binding protein [Romboutsia faecis]MBC5995867.1 ABC transporter ATP-binding protein [Romboutsia faecis]MRN23066.1 ABC transporter ATP-binding protein [Romboutsia ilealis]